MSKNRVIWKEGLFVQPQHFQQQQRHIDYLIQNQLLALNNNYNCGLISFDIDREMLNLGRISLLFAEGVFPDGTYFNFPSQDLLPHPIEIKQLDNASSYDVYLALPNINTTFTEIHSDYHNQNNISIRYKESLEDIRDTHSPNGNSNTLFLAKLSPKLIQGSEEKSAYTYLHIARIRDKLADGRIVLDDKFIPTCMDVAASSELRAFIGELASTLEQRAETLSSRIGSPSQQGIADVAEFLMLQLLNREYPLYKHLNIHPHIHPEYFYRLLIQLCGELMTFTDASRLPKEFLRYDHFDMTECFQRLFKQLRISLSTVLTPKAVSIQLESLPYGVKTAVINDQDLLYKAEFILAVSARMPEELLRKQLVQQIKITTPDKIRQLVSVQLPGIELRPLTMAPRQLPYHAGYIYFYLDIHSDEWIDVQKNHAIAFHVSGEFPELDMQLWAIRG
ncbi:type VI secretion system baseplate subunit TssK [Pasteurella sp. PK-2025]|uniref:type VI secretion system baseplate subunit TssK n=1 Tax=unclassified Pasteurella TaxID=2621516 RepID=UPI003C74391D